MPASSAEPSSRWIGWSMRLPDTVLRDFLDLVEWSTRANDAPRCFSTHAFRARNSLLFLCSPLCLGRDVPVIFGLVVCAIRFPFIYVFWTETIARCNVVEDQCFPPRQPESFSGAITCLAFALMARVRR